MDSTTGPIPILPTVNQATPITALFNNLPALTQGIQNLNQPGKVTLLGVYGDSVWAGTGSSDINTSFITRFRTKFLDIRNAKIGGSAKSGRGRFGPFHHAATGAVAGTAGPIIIGGSSGWVKTANFYYQDMFGESLTHPGGVTPGAGTAYAGCYMAMSQVGLTGNACRWLGLIFNSGSTGVFRVQFRQGASVTQVGTTGTNRYLITGGVPDPASNAGDVKLDVTIDPTTSSYPDMEAFITGHLNSTTMDPTTVWQVCIYRTTNAATSVQIHGFDAHYDEYSAQNTPSIYGATCLMDVTRPGTTFQLAQGGASTYGTNPIDEAQSTQNRHINVHARPYNKTAKFTHTMPVLELGIANFWRNDLNGVESTPDTTPAGLKQRIQMGALAFAKVGIPFVQFLDIGCSASYICSGPYFDQGTAMAQQYTDAVNQAVTSVAGLTSTKLIGGGACAFRIDLARGTGGPQSYARRNLFSTADNLHPNDAGAELDSDIAVQACTNPAAIQPYSTVANTISYNPNSITSRLGISKTTVLELDPHKYGSIRLSGGDGYYPYALRCTDFGVLLSGIGNLPADGTGISTYKLGQTKSGGAANIIYNMDQFGQRAGLEFDNIAAGLSGITYDLSSLWTGALASGMTQVTIFFITQNQRTTDLTAATNNQQHYWNFGSTADKAGNYTSIYDAAGTQRVLLGAVQGVYNGQLMCRVGNQIPTIAVASTGATNAAPGPGRVPTLGCITFDTTTRVVRTRESINDAWRSVTSDASLANPWKPDWLCIGKLLGTGATGAPAAFGGLWLINGIVTDAEYTTIWNQIYAESGGFFNTGTSAGTFGQGGTIIV